MDIPTTIFIFVIDICSLGDFRFPPTVHYLTPWLVKQNWALVEIVILTRVTDLLILTT